MNKPANYGLSSNKLPKSVKKGSRPSQIDISNRAQSLKDEA